VASSGSAEAGRRARVSVIDYSDDEGLLITGSSPQAETVQVPQAATVTSEAAPPAAEESYTRVDEAPGLSADALVSPEGEAATPPRGYDQVLTPPIERTVERDLAWLAGEIARLLPLRRQGYHVALYHLERADLSRDELRQLLAMLRDTGLLPEFMRWAAQDELWGYLSSHGVDWEFVFNNYAYGPTDSIDFFAGFSAGALGSAAEVLRLPWDVVNGLYVLTGSIFDEELAQRRDAFIGALKCLLTHPLVTGELRAKEWWDEFNARLGRLQWFQAGAMLGAVVPDIVGAAAAVPGLVKGTASLLAKLPRLTRSLLAARLPRADLEGLVKALKSGQRTWRSPAGNSVEVIDEVAVLRRADGTPEGVLPVNDDFIADVEKWLDESAGTPGDDIRTGLIDPTVSDAIDFKRLAEELVEAFPQRELSAAEWGKLIHRKAAERLRETFAKLGPDLSTHADEPFSAILELDPDLATLTVEDFLKRFPEVSELTSVARDARLLTSRVGSLKPDLLIFNKATGQAVVVDLAPTSTAPHLRKTQLYASILDRLGKGVTSVTIGEYYYGAVEAANNAAAATARKAIQKSRNLSGSGSR
jgi:hypothetical protein